MKKIQPIRSTLSAEELGEYFIDQYQLDKTSICKLFRTGMNHTYFISSDETKHVIRVYSHNWRTQDEISEEIKLLSLLDQNGINVSCPIQDKYGAYIQEIEAPEGIRYAVLFSFAEGQKVRFMDNETCFSVGELMAKFHQITSDKTLKRIVYNKESLITWAYGQLKHYFSEELPAMQFIQKIGNAIDDSDFDVSQSGIVHLDIWYDNMAITDEKVISLFDFDFCGNGKQILDVGYFCKHMFMIEANKKQYELKIESFLKGYQSIRRLSNDELELIPEAVVAVFIFYLGVQAQRFDWSNLFLSENYLEMYVGRLENWLEYHANRPDTD